MRAAALTDPAERISAEASWAARRNRRRRIIWRDGLFSLSVLYIERAGSTAWRPVHSIERNKRGEGIKGITRGVNILFLERRHLAAHRLAP